ncbi:MAG TPA: VOC family protein [Nakamurella sp.]
MTDADRPAVTLGMITVDCADAAIAAEFWSTLMGWEVVASGDGYAMLSGGGHTVGFGSVPDYDPPPWPNENGSKQFHFDLACADIAATQARAVEFGATVADPQPGETWRVLIDPSGHPFCLTDAKNWG